MDTSRWRGCEISKIIYLEDNPELREMMYNLYSDTFDIITTGTPELVMKLCQGGDVAVVMADHHMEPIKGTTVLKNIYKNHPKIRRLLITGDKSSELLVEAVNGGHIHGVYHKPLDFFQLKDDLSSYLAEYLKKNQNERQKEILLDQVVKLREELYYNNKVDYENLDMSRIIPRLQFRENIAATLIQNLEQIGYYWSNEDFDKIDLSVINHTLADLLVISSEFNETCYSNRVELLNFILRNIEARDINTDELIVLKEKIENYSHPECKVELHHLVLDIANIVHEGFDTQNQMLIELMGMSISKSLASLKRKQLIQLDDTFLEELSHNLGYFIVIINQVTAYYREFNPRMDFNPSLIGNLSMALIDFSSELFEESFEVQAFEQQNGLLLIHRASQDIYYVCMAYKEYKFYEVWLKQFARKTAAFFETKSSNIWFEDKEIEELDRIADRIVHSGR